MLTRQKGKGKEGDRGGVSGEGDQGPYIGGDTNRSLAINEYINW